MAPRTFPWVFPYVREPRAPSSPFAGRDLLRPAVPLATLLAIEDWDAFDIRFGVPATTPPENPPRFRP